MMAKVILAMSALKLKPKVKKSVHNMKEYLPKQGTQSKHRAMASWGG